MSLVIADRRRVLTAVSAPDKAGGPLSSLGGYPLAALVGQNEMVRALILLAVAPDIGGLLLVGEKGTAKSTAARALAELLPPFEARDCPYHCRATEPQRWCVACQTHPGSVTMVSAPFKTVPLGVTEERLLGGLDWEKTVRSGRPFVRPGLLGEANNGIVYIDEVNLLDPGLAHLLLDAVSSRRVILERDSFSVSYPAAVALLGSMNPEEGPLGPQLADRFALTVRLIGERDPKVRSEIVRRRLEYEGHPAAFIAKYRPVSLALTQRIEQARLIVKGLVLSEAARAEASKLAGEACVAGHRAELAMCRAALADAAWELAGAPLVSWPPGGADEEGQSGADQIIEIGAQWLQRVEALVLPERRRAPVPTKTAVKVKKAQRPPEGSAAAQAEVVVESPQTPPQYKSDGLKEDGVLPMTVFEVAQSFEIITPKSPKETGVREKSGRRSWRETLKARGRAFKTTARRLGRPLSISATLRAAAPHQATRRLKQKAGGQLLVSGSAPVSQDSAEQLTDRSRPAGDLILTPADFREKVYRLKTGRLVVFVVDCSGSIGTLYRMEEAKAAAMSLLRDAYRRRDRVAVIAFYGSSAEILLPPTNSPDLAGRLLANLPSGGKTPLAAALALTHRLIVTERAKDPKVSPHVILMTDGRPNIPLDRNRQPWPEVLEMADHLAADPTVRFLLIDTDRGAYNDYKLTRELSVRLGCPRINLEELREGRLENWLEK
ncbi:MAG: VWA domain-containing protein [Deltaproteobacteria bacterium]|jgi:magnesium chelatase subunit D|nr:VWA domain-containing protein [Deltaproteobacteria bacterium]